jgi:hypothetical protein
MAIFVIAGQAHASQRESWRHETCRYQGAAPRSWTRWEVKATIRCAVDRWPVSLSTAMYIAHRESGFYARAYNPSSGASGVYQWLARYWPGVRANYNRHVIFKMRVSDYVFNARSNVLTAIRYAHYSGWGPWS